jgi:hypothetical protein
MQSHLDDLNGSVVAGFYRSVDWQRDEWEAEGTRIWIFARPDQLKYGVHDVSHVRGRRAEAHIDVKERCRMASVPSRSYGDGPAREGPAGSVVSYGQTSTWWATVSSGNLVRDEREEKREREKERERAHKGISTACRPLGCFLATQGTGSRNVL